MWYSSNKWLQVIILIYCLLAGLDGSICRGQNRAKVLLIGLDGCRSDALKQVNTPHIDQLIQKGYSCFESRTVVPTMSGPGWTSMLTGVWYTEHQVHGNLFIGHQLHQYPPFYDIVQNSLPALRTASISHWGPINEKIIRTANHKSSPKSDKNVCIEAMDILQNKDPDLVFLHFDDIDHAGHFSGFDPNNKQYCRAIEGVDHMIGQVLLALKNRKTRASEDWLIILSTDHGGIRRNHGGGTQVERTTFIIAHKNNIEVQQAKATINYHKKSPYIQLDSSNQFFFIAANDSLLSADWDLQFLLKINQWEAGASLLKTPQVELRTHPKDGFSWLLYAQDPPLRIQGDTIKDKLWHKINLQYKQGILKVFQNDRLIGLKKQALKAGTAANILEILATENSFNWSISQLSLTYDIPAIYNSTYQLEHFLTKDKKPLKYLKKEALIQYNSYRHFPLIIDIVPTILTHLSIPQKQWPSYLNGNALPINK